MFTKNFTQNFTPREYEDYYGHSRAELETEYPPDQCSCCEETNDVCCCEYPPCRMAVCDEHRVDDACCACALASKVNRLRMSWSARIETTNHIEIASARSKAWYAAELGRLDLIRRIASGEIPVGA